MLEKIPKKLKSTIAYTISIYVIVLFIWILLIGLGEIIEVGYIFGSVVILLFWVYISPSKLLMQGLAITPPSYFSPLSDMSMSIYVWTCIHIFNITILIILSIACYVVLSILKKFIGEKKEVKA